jgi:hypothetical protein
LIGAIVGDKEKVIISRIMESIRKADYGTLLLEMFVLISGVLLALAVDRWNQNRVDAIETDQIVERLKSDTVRNLAMFDETLPAMKGNLANIKALFRALEAGSVAGQDQAHIELGIANIDVVPSYPLVFAGYDELVATGRLRQLGDPVLIDLLGNQRAEYEAAQAVVSYWRDSVQGATEALDHYVDYYFTTEQMDEEGMGVRFDIAEIAADRVLKNNVFDAVDIHGDWLRFQTSIYEITREIDVRLNAQ